jgi:hypothetical protein
MQSYFYICVFLVNNQNISLSVWIRNTPWPAMRYIVVLSHQHDIIIASGNWTLTIGTHLICGM